MPRCTDAQKTFQGISSNNLNFEFIFEKKNPLNGIFLHHSQFETAKNFFGSSGLILCHIRTLENEDKLCLEIYVPHHLPNMLGTLFVYQYIVARVVCVLVGLLSATEHLERANSRNL